MLPFPDRLKFADRLPWYLEPSWTAREAYFDDELPWVTLDLETTNLRKGDSRVDENRVVLACHKIRELDGTRIFVDQSLDNFKHTFDGERALLIAQNAKFELGWLIRAGIDISQFLVWDTMIAEFVLAGNRKVELGLGAIAERYGFPGKEPLIDAMMRAGVCPSEMPEKWLRDRAVRDVETTESIALQQMKKLVEGELIPVMFTRCITTPVLASIEREGMYLDREAVYTEYELQSAQRERCEQELSALSGGINLRSGKQLAEFIYGGLGFKEITKRGEPQRTASGQRKVDSDTLASLVATTDVQRRFKTLRAAYGLADARITKSLEFFRGVVDEYGEHFHGTFNQTIAQTHRLTSSGVRLKFRDGKERGAQFQNLPREYKRFFRPRDPDYLYVEVDGAQLEFRVAGEMSRDAQVKQDVETGADIHRFTASVLHRKGEGEVTKAERTAAKAHTFKPLYGGQSGTPREIEYYEAFRAKYASVYATQTGWITTVLKTKQLRIPSGLVFYWPDTKVTQSGYVTNTPNVFNYPIQSFATADIIPVSLVYTFWRARVAGIRAVLTNTVHDSVAAEVHKDDVDKYRQITLDCWLDDTYEYLSRVYDHRMWVPLAVGFTVGTRWGQGEEEKHTRVPRWHQ